MKIHDCNDSKRMTEMAEDFFPGVRFIGEEVAAVDESTRVGEPVYDLTEEDSIADEHRPFAEACSCSICVRFRNLGY